MRNSSKKFYEMVNPLYAVAAFTCALVVLLLPMRTRTNLSKKDPLDKAFLRLIDWTCLFCLADSFWGVVASEIIMNDGLLRISSFIFHLFASFTPLVWLQFVLAYLGKVKFRKIFQIVALLIFAGEVLLLIQNFFTHTIFYVDAEGAYNSGPLRKYLFYAQYANYVTMAVVALLHLTGNNGTKSSHIAVLAFVAAPILCGIFQQLYPDAPAYSIGYMLGCCIIYSFVLSEMLEARAVESMRISSANKAKTTFLNNMSHDIRTPLNAITGFNNMALKELGKDNEKVKDYLKKIGHSSDTLLSIINDILEISRIESGKISITEDKGNVLYSFANIESMMKEVARTAGIDLEFSFGKVEDLYVVCDISHCCRIFTNLISNAIKYTERGGKVIVRCEQTGRREDGYGIYTYTVKDNGIGMSEEFQKQLFQPFARENSSTVSRIQGTGLGLAMCKNLAEKMGGSISCVSRKGEGSTFTLVLPFKIQEGQEYEIPQNGMENIAGLLKGRHILLVEDNPLNREIAMALLEEMEAEVTEADDGSAAVEIMKSPEAENLDIILMDIQMPVIDGYEATRQIRALGTEASRIPIIAMTANAFGEDRKKAIAAGMNAHVAKPIDILRLTETLAKFL